MIPNYLYISMYIFVQTKESDKVRGLDLSLSRDSLDAGKSLYFSFYGSVLKPDSTDSIA